jgi:high-affinity iron transporter
MVRISRLIGLGFLLVVVGGFAIRASAADRFEVTSIKAVRPTLVKTIAALKKNDIAAAKAAFAEYDNQWTGIETYINARNKTMYTEMEQGLQGKINKGLDMPNPDVPALLDTAQMLLARYDDAIAMVEKGEPLNPLFDDVARLRIAREDLRDIPPALKAGDMAKARKAYSGFDHKWGSVEGLIKSRSQDADDAITKDLGQIKSALGADKPDVDQAGALVKDLTDKYNAVVGDITKDARAQK